jgi:hypothetical protein
VRKVERLLYLAEYKRRQSAPGVKVGPRNFSRDRRYPIVNRFRDPGLKAQKPDPSIAPRKSVGTSERFEEQRWVGQHETPCSRGAVRHGFTVGSAVKLARRCPSCSCERYAIDCPARKIRLAASPSRLSRDARVHRRHYWAFN